MKMQVDHFNFYIKIQLELSNGRRCFSLSIK